jgi:hypothetical protein
MAGTPGFTPRQEGEEFLKQVKAVEEGMIQTLMLFMGDREVHQEKDLCQAIWKVIVCHQIRYEGGDFLGDKTGPCQATAEALACRRSRLISEMHSLWHDIASRRYQFRFGLVLDNPKAAVSARDRWVEEHYPNGTPRSGQ